MTIRDWRPFSKSFLSEAGRRRVVDAIAAAEEGTSGEIRVHIEARSGKDALERARVVFDRLGMADTARRNGVLIYVATADHQFAIVGDEGIHREVGDGYWEAIRDRMEARFRTGEFAEGLCEAVARVGEVLRSAFPAEAGDVNELSNEPSIGPDEPDAGRS
jgi:uncharacterized membrane protein